ncbi:MAG: hypothetical protein DCF22_18480 [Leptolyngbya sp.]|nr:MAG: hypothetical protein DCF22_18480 [Leptolyngbya sp.]
MKANPLFLNQPKSFWANVRTISQHLGYTLRGSAQIKVPSLNKMCLAMQDLGLSFSHIADGQSVPTDLGELLLRYYEYRADVLNNHVRQKLMNVVRAREVFTELKESLNPYCPIPMNKQKGDKRAEAYFTGIINMLIEANAEGLQCDYDPRELTAITYNKRDVQLRLHKKSPAGRC